MTVSVVRSIDLRLVDGGWPLDAATRRRVDDHWAAVLARNPHLWNGQVLGCLAPGRPGGMAIDAAGRLTGGAVAGDFAGFLAWRDWGFPDIGIRNLFASVVIRGADGVLVFGVMGPTTANAGQVYPVGGSLEPRDVAADRRIDVTGSAGRELAEETGLDAGAANLATVLAVFDGARISIAHVLDFADEAAAIAARIRAFIAREDKPELADVALIRRPSDLPDRGVPGYARTLAAHLLDGKTPAG